MSDAYPPATPHGALTEVLPDLFQVKGSIRMKPAFRFSRNMTVVRHDGALTLLNTVRLDEAGLAALDALGKVENVIKLGGHHGLDDRFYVDRYGALYQVLEGDRPAKGIDGHEVITEGGPLPIPGAEMFFFKTTTLAEGLLRLDRDGGVLVSCDALQNWAPDEYCDLFTRVVMTLMGFFKPCNIGPGWIRASKPQANDFERLLALSFEHVLCGHGEPVIGDAKARYAPAIKKHFGVG
ncbi:MAG: hypothetical protein H6739_31630 [Alphaproteobacteria bacterium]|nr:hypothetical protein [Alphaproteobacteria bacterium]